MFDRVFNKKAFALSAALMTAALPAMAGDSFPKVNFSKENSATAEKWVQEGCAGQCTDKLVLVTYSSIGKDKAFARAGFNATKRLHEEGLPVFYVMASDNNDNVQDAVMMPYINGVREDGVKLETKYGFINKDTIRRQGTEEAMYSQAKFVYNQYLQASNSSPENPAATLALSDTTTKDVTRTLAMQ